MRAPKDQVAEEAGQPTTVDPEQSGGWGGSPGGTLSWIGRIAGSTARRAGCDAQHTIVTLGPDGRSSKPAPPPVLHPRPTPRHDRPRRRPLLRPYCDRPISWADGHHLVPVARNGPTTIANGAIPCDGHHMLLHEGHWQLHRLPDGRYLMTHPGTGRTIGPEEHPPRPQPTHPETTPRRPRP